MGEWDFGRGFVLRCPVLPCPGSFPDVASRRAWMAATLGDPLVADALALASTSLVAELDSWRREPDSPRGQQVERSLTRYLARMTGRATPFGLFSGVAVGRWGERNAIALRARTSWSRRTELESSLLDHVCETMGHDPDRSTTTPLRVNPSLYRVGDRLRYARQTADNSALLTEIAATPHLLRTIARCREGLGIASLTAGLCEDLPEVDHDDARAFVSSLCAAGILIPAISPPLTGSPPMHALLEAARAAGLPATPRIEEVITCLRDLDAQGVGLGPSDDSAARAALDALAPAFEGSKRFNVDVDFGDAGELGPDVQATIRAAIDLIERLAVGEPNAALDHFRDAFVARYGTAEVPFMVALDEDGGIAFGNEEPHTNATLPLLAGLRFPPQARTASVPIARRDEHLMRRLEQALRENADEIELHEHDLRVLEARRATPLPAAACVLATLAATSPEALTRGDVRVLVEWIDGPSGAKLLGRFCHLSPAVDALAREHLRTEEALRPDALFAEIVHDGGSVARGVLGRPVLRTHELVVAGVSGASPAAQIDVDDLTLSVVDDEIVLRSRRLDRRIEPRMTSAHNHAELGHAPYRFLCALQEQGGRGGGFSWGPLRHAPFLPRVRVGNVVLARARWLVDADELAALRSPGREPVDAASIVAARGRLRTAMQELRARRRIPRWVVLAEGDNELPVDLDDELELDALVHLVRGRARIVLRERFGGPQGLVPGAMGLHAHQLLCTFVRRQPPRRAPSAPTAMRPRPRHHGFEPGGPWLYLKLYAGTGIADRLLRDAIAPLVHSARAEGIADRWFFLRYRDPDPHLRVRLRGEPRRLWGELLPRFHAELSPWIANERIHGVQVDSYAPEHERYGGPAGLDVAERIFEADSDAVLHQLEAIERDADPASARWQTTLLGMHRLLLDLDPSPHARAQVIQDLAASFAAEHAADLQLRRQLGDLHRRERASILALLTSPSPCGERFDARSRAVRSAIVDASEIVRAPGYAASLLHMHANRMFASQARAQEFVVYDLLRRAYATIAAMSEPAMQRARTRPATDSDGQKRPRTPSVGSV